MEQHPVPQNVTTFQFRLIGDMTLKQFGYLVGGAILAYIMYKLPLPFFFTWPLAVLSAVGGFGLAFVPIEERPMDVWILSFFKSIYSPTQYIWSREAGSRPQATGQQQPLAAPVGQTPVAPQVLPMVQQMTPAPPPIAERQAHLTPASRKGDILNNIFLPSVASPPAAPAILTQTKKRGMFDWLFDFMTPKPKSPTPAPAWSSMSARQMDFSPPPIVRSSPTQKTIDDTKQKESALEEKLKVLQKELEGKTVAESRIVELQTQLTELLAEHENMEKELAAMRKLTASPPTAVEATPTSTTTTQTPKTPTVQIITPDRAVKVGLPRLTSFPNVVTGIVKDKDKNLLPGVLVTVKDKDGIPLRALKTNRLGQFAASTPLTNGVYLIEVEDPRLRYSFDRAQITLNGTIVPALEIFAKTEKEITRAKLEKELFGDKTNLTNPTNKPI